MFESFTDRARRVVQLAQQEAHRMNHEYVGTEHLLLGLIKEGSGVAANVLANLGVSLAGLRVEVEKVVVVGPAVVSMGRLPMSPRAKRVIETAVNEADSLAHRYVGTEHLLLALCGEEETVAAQVLLGCGLTTKAIRAEVLEVLTGAKSPGEPATEKCEPQIVLTDEDKLAIAMRRTRDFIGTTTRELGIKGRYRIRVNAQIEAAAAERGAESAD